MADLALHLILRHCGENWTLKSLRLMLRDWARPPNHPQPPFMSGHRTVHDPRVRKALFLIEQHMSTPPTVQPIARQVNTSPRQLERLFRKHLGESPSSYSRTVRLQYGHWLLTHTERSITQVAFDCGFSDGSHFSRSFRAEFQRSPAALRREKARVESE